MKNFFNLIACAGAVSLVLVSCAKSPATALTPETGEGAIVVLVAQTTDTKIYRFPRRDGGVCYLALRNAGSGAMALSCP